MHYLYLRKSTVAKDEVKYTYHFDDHNLSPANQILTRLFRQMVLAVEESLDGLEAEYIDAKMAAELGPQRARELLQTLGASKGNISENKHGEVVISRTFKAPLTEGALEYFKSIKDLEELSAYRLLSRENVKVEVYFTKIMFVMLNKQEERKFLDLLHEDRIRYKTI